MTWTAWPDAPAALMPLSMGVALTVDRLWGEPPAWAHPVVAMGRYLGGFSRWLTGRRPAAGFLAGAGLWALGAGFCMLAALAAQTLLARWLPPQRSTIHLAACALLLGLLLKPLLAWRMLRDEVAAVETALRHSLPAGRQQLARLVSRDTGPLAPAEVREAAIETLAENLNDSVAAPLFWFLLAGLPGAALYRFANTADAMWGYRGPWEWAGKWAARADDALSWLPARLTALALLSVRLGPAASWSALRAEARRTPSPNGGWPMGAMALKLDRRLSKPGVYVLNEGARPPEAGDLQRAQDLAQRALLVLALAMMAAAAWRGAW
ncbi:MAG: cobalamin biosynthesis protein CobD [Paucibacter sp.]|nr:cobalamin biosynthesis protein CobD [Roseateles sp.]